MLLEDRKKHEEQLATEREDRRRREEEISEERERRDREIAEERERRERQIAEDREHRDREAVERTRLMEKQMEALQDMVEASSKREATPRESEQPKLTKLTEQDDVEAYLTTFERMMGVFRVEKEKWAYKQAPQLTGKAQKVFAGMEDEEAGNYDALKAAILRRYDINEETYRQRLRTVSRRRDESYREMSTRARELTRKWTKECNNVQDFIKCITVEQLLNSMEEEVRVWVTERKPKTCAEAGELADDYVQARRNGKTETYEIAERSSTSKPPEKCFT